ncbi:MAG TPA: hypothetical protein PLK02_05060 [Paludibacteraceae bacterium]|nr:hypothetical protein [Paludibacteraceae bacterium]HPL94452.1 hypothetical protein [Paludibacteraceae bacterium]
MTQNQVHTAVQAFVQNFISNSYLHRCEHSLHIALYNELFLQAPQQFVFCQKHQTNFVHKEFPGRKTTDAPILTGRQLVDRTSIDIVVLSKQQVNSIKDFLAGNLDVDFAFELSLEYGIEHLCWDIFKFITGSNRSIDSKNYIIHLYHKERVQSYFDTEKINGNTMWNENGYIVENSLNNKVEWCYYLINLCIAYSQKTNNDDYDKIMAIIKHFVCKKYKSITTDNYDNYLPDTEFIKNILQNMKFIITDANPKKEKRFASLSNI